MKKDLKVGDSVFVNDPSPKDVWNHSFQGTIAEVVEPQKRYIVKDQEDNCFDVDFKNISLKG